MRDPDVIGELKASVGNATGFAVEEDPLVFTVTGFVEGETEGTLIYQYVPPDSDGASGGAGGAQARTTVIVGAVLGAVLGACCCFWLLVLLLARRRTRSEPSDVLPALGFAARLKAGAPAREGHSEKNRI